MPFFRTKPLSAEQRTRMESQWRRAQAADAVARRAAWRVTLQLLRQRSAWIEQAGELAAWLLRVTAYYLGCALFVIVIACLALGTVSPPAEVRMLAGLFASLAVLFWLPFGGVRALGSPFVTAWNRAYSTARRERWGKGKQQ